MNSFNTKNIGVFINKEREEMKLTVEIAEKSLAEAEKQNPGAWGDHSRYVVRHAVTLPKNAIIYLPKRRIFMVFCTISGVMREFPPKSILSTDIVTAPKEVGKKPRRFV